MPVEEFEEWRPIPGFDGRYDVSSIGRIRSRARNWPAGPRVMKPCIGRRNGLPYWHLILACSGRPLNLKVHKLVALAFLGTPKDGQVVRHKDGDSLNNCADNLEYGTRSDNNFDTVRHGHHYHASKNHCVNGHEFSAENTRVVTEPNGWTVRYCRACSRARGARYRERNRSDVA